MITQVGRHPKDNDGTLSAFITDLAKQLRPCDGAHLLPGSGASKETKDLKNVILMLGSKDSAPPLHVFSTDWGHGVSIIRVPDPVAQLWCNSPERRILLMQKIVAAVPCELASTSINVGPRLRCQDHHDEPGDNWTIGFDGENCSVGIYESTEIITPTAAHVAGISRPTKSFFLVVKAGAGLAAQQFHSELNGLASKGNSLYDINENHLLEAKMKRVISAARRNRAAILAKVVDIMEATLDFDLCPDNGAAPDVPPKQLAMLMADCVTNVLARVSAEDGENHTWYYYAGAVAPMYSQSSITCSNVTEGYVLFSNKHEVGTNESMNFRNDAGGALPFSSPRTRETDVVIADAVAHHLSGKGHPDAEWVSSHIRWYEPEFSRIGHLSESVQKCIRSIEPSQLWGSHASTSYDQWLPSLGADEVKALRLFPVLVVLPGNELISLRSAAAIVDERCRTVTDNGTRHETTTKDDAPLVEVQHTTIMGNATYDTSCTERQACKEKVDSDDESGADNDCYVGNVYLTAVANNTDDE